MSKEFFGSTYESDARLKLLQTKLDAVTAERDELAERLDDAVGEYYESMDFNTMAEFAVRCEREVKTLRQKLEASESATAKHLKHSEGCMRERDRYYENAIKYNKKLSVAVEALKMLSEESDMYMFAEDALVKIGGME